ncbi:MAG: Fic family protein [Patescibacteria group bacterium]
MIYLEEKLQQRLDDKKDRLNKLRPLPTSAISKIREQFEIEMTYNSNAIEGNSLTLKETFLVINEGITVKGKPFKDHLEAKNQKEALGYLYNLVEKDKRNTISERLIRSLQQLVTQNIDKDWAGKYRTGNVRIGGSKHNPPEAIAIPKLMDDLVVWIGKNRTKLHPVELAGLVHHKLVHIHPFFDGNGRTARLIMNIVLMQASFPLAIILKNDRKKYYTVLAQADLGNYKPLTKFVAQAVERSLDIYLKMLTTGGKKENFLSLSELSKKTPYSEKYLNLLARQGKLEAHKDGRNWLTSEEALNRYLEGRERKH